MSPSLIELTTPLFRAKALRQEVDAIHTLQTSRPLLKTLIFLNLSGSERTSTFRVHMNALLALATLVRVINPYNIGLTCLHKQTLAVQFLLFNGTLHVLQWRRNTTNFF